jgi:RimJ/RimL family protein N-acetyltransferase
MGRPFIEPTVLETQRLLLRPWREADLEPFASINADPRVTATLPRSLTRPESDALAARIVDRFQHNGFGQWAVEIPGVAPFIGFIGLAAPSFEAHFTPAIEIGWRLAFERWGRGYATEGASAVLKFAFTRAGMDEVVSFTSQSNTRSRAVMERIGMQYDPIDDFDHPALDRTHPLLRHVLYRLRREAWRERA